MPVLTTLGAATAKAWGFLQQVAAAADPYFNYVTMLLTGNGTNGAQNNTFLDSSSNAFSITRNGNTTQGSFSPYGSLWSNYLTGGATLEAATGSAVAFGSGDYTVEMWIYPTAAWDTGGQNMVFFNGSTNGFMFANRPGGFGVRAVNNTDVLLIATRPTINTWTHIAACRSGGTLRIFYNGVLQGSTTDSISWASGNVVFGSESGSNIYNGYISNCRVVKGSALYTSDFTPSTTPLTAVTNTSFLGFQSNRFIDNSSNAISISITAGTPSVQRFSPFNPTASYDTATIGGSGYFDGNGDYLTASSSLMAYGTSTKNTDTFTCEAWVYLTTYGSPSEPAQSMSMISKGDIYFTWGIYSDGKAVVYSYDGSTHNSFSTGTIPLNTWTYLAFTVSGGTITHYINGVSSGTGTWYGMSSTTDLLRIGRVFNTYWNGYISNLRISTNARTITLPTSPLTSDANTALLCKYDNAGIPDSAMMNDLETVGNAQVSTSVKKFGTGSISLDGTGDWLQLPTTTNFDLGTGDFTIEGWVYFNSFGNYSLVGKWSSGGYAWIVQTRTDIGGNGIRFYTGNNGSLSSNYTFLWSPSNSTWYHLAITRSGSNLKLFIDGTQQGSTATIGSQSLSSTSGVCTVGATGDGFDQNWNGYIDDLRITKGYARYTSNFTAPTAAFPTY